MSGKKVDPHDVGYIGEVPDPTPNENYTVAGVLAGKPTPETERPSADEDPEVTTPDEKPDEKKKG